MAETSARIIKLRRPAAAATWSRESLVEEAKALGGDAGIAEAAGLLANDHLVAFPTETVYGLGANATSDTAVQKIYSAKGRPPDNPLIVHVSGVDMAKRVLRAPLPPVYEYLAEQFWPGPLTMICPDSNNASTVCATAKAGAPSVGIRMPGHPVALALISKADVPVAAPSANLSSRPSPTKAAHVESDLGTGRGLSAVVDVDACPQFMCTVGLESTVVDVVESEKTIRILRPGGISDEMLAAALAHFHPAYSVQVYHRDFLSKSLQDAPTTPGMKYKHYSPANSRVVLVNNVRGAQPLSQVVRTVAVDKEYLGFMLSHEGARDASFAVGAPLLKDVVRIEKDAWPWHMALMSLGPRGDASHACQALFAGLRAFDAAFDAWAQPTQAVFLEAYDPVGLGFAYMERANKAAGGTPVIDCDFRG